MRHEEPAFLRKDRKSLAGRPTKITEELIQKICLAIKVGSYIETAAIYCGVSKDLLFKWFQNGHKNPNSIYGKFLLEVEKAFAESELRDISIINDAARGSVTATPIVDPNGNQLIDKDGQPMWIIPKPPNWNAAAWRLERKFPKKWGRRDSLSLTDENQKDQDKELTPEKIEVEIQKILKRLT